MTLLEAADGLHRIMLAMANHAMSTSEEEPAVLKVTVADLASWADAIQAYETSRLATVTDENKTAPVAREIALRAAQRIVKRAGHHAVWLSAAGYRADPLDQKIVDAALASACASIDWLIAHPEADREVPDHPKPVQGWQPIETAPKDGTRIDIWAIRETTGEASRYTDCIWGRRHYGTEPYGEPVWLGLQDPHSKITPTHWMPQPMPPVLSQTMPVPELTAENTEFLEFEDIVRCCAEKPDRFNWTPEELTVGRAIRSASCEAPTYPFHVFSGGEAEANIVMWCRYAARAAIKAVRELEQIIPAQTDEDYWASLGRQLGWGLKGWNGRSAASFGDDFGRYFDVFTEDGKLKVYADNAEPPPRCPACNCNWRWNPPATVDGSDQVRCEECDAVSVRADPVTRNGDDQ